MERRRFRREGWWRRDKVVEGAAGWGCGAGQVAALGEVERDAFGESILHERTHCIHLILSCLHARSLGGLLVWEARLAMAAAAVLTTAIALMPPSPTIGRRALLAAAVPLAAHVGLPPAAHADSSSLLRLPMPDRLIAVGDLHGDCAVFERVLRVAGLYDGGRWTGGSAVLVQIGDVLDRGDEELQLLRLLRTLKKEAAAAGGAVITLLGNHEVLNAMGISVYASPRSATAFGDDGERASAFRAGSELATELSSWPVACVVGDTAFIHGGLTLAQVSGGLGDLNAASSDWLKGRRALTAQIGSSTPDLWLEAPASTWSQP